MHRKVFVAGEILTAADVNTNLMDQSVMTFASSAARGSAIPSPTEGMTSYLDDLNRIEVYNGSAWGAVGTILQVVSTAKTDTFSTTSTSHTDVTGLTATITPSSTSSKILVMATVNVSTGANDRYVSVQLARGGTGIFIGDADGAKTRAFASLQSVTAAYFIAEGLVNFSPIFLDSPASTSALTYSVQARISNSDSTVFVNRTATDTNDARFVRGSSSITVMEVAG